MNTKTYILILIVFFIYIFSACNPSPNRKNKIAANQSILDTGKKFIIIKKDTTSKRIIDSTKIDSTLIAIKKDTIVVRNPIVKKDSIVKNSVIKTTVNQQNIINFAKNFIGKPYVTGSKDPVKGFDNSGFVNYVFENFKIITPRYSAAYIVVGNKVLLADAAEGDIILFSKTDSIKTVVNSLGIVISGKGQPIEFIHSSSGKVKGVTTTKLNSYYQKRLIGFRRVID